MNVAQLEVSLLGNITDLEAKLTAANTLLKEFAASPAANFVIKPTVDLSAIAGLDNALKSIVDKTVKVTVNAEGAIAEVTALGNAMRAIKDKDVFIRLHTEGNLPASGQSPTGTPNSRFSSSVAPIASRVDQPLRDLVASERRVTASAWSPTIQDAQDFRAKEALESAYEKARLTQAQAANLSYNRENEMARGRELASLRNDIQSRLGAEEQALQGRYNMLMREAPRLAQQRAALSQDFNRIMGQSQDLIGSAETRGGAVGERIAARMLRDRGMSGTNGPNGPLPGTGSSRWANMSSGFQNFATGMILENFITRPLMDAGTNAVSAAGDFQEKMKLVGTMTDVGTQNVASLSRQVLQLSKDPNIKSGPLELADGLYMVASKGLDAAHSMEALRASALGNSAGLGGINVIGKTITDVGAAFGRTDFSRIIDTITVAVRKGGGEANQYAAAFSKVIPIAAQAGVSFEEVAAQMASATRIGLSPSETATALRQVFNNLIDPSEKAKRAMKEMGTSVDEVRKMLRDQGLFNTLKDLSERTGGRIGPITELFGNIRALTGFLATTGKNTLSEYKETLDATFAANGDTLGAATENAKGFNFQMERLKSAAEAFAVTVGTRAIPAATDFIKGLTDDLPVALRAWDNLASPVKTVVLAITGLLALSGPLLAFAGTIQIVARAIGALGGMEAIAAFLTGPIGIVAVVAGIAALGLGFQAIKAHFAAAAEQARLLADNADHLQKSLENIGSATSGISAAQQTIKKLREEVTEAGEDGAKLHKALEDTAKARVDISNMGFAPGLLDSIDREFADLIANLQNRGKHANVTIAPTQERIITARLGMQVPQVVPAGRSNHFRDQAEADRFEYDVWRRRAAAVGLVLPPSVNPSPPGGRGQEKNIQEWREQNAIYQEAYKDLASTVTKIRSLENEQNRLAGNSQAASLLGRIDTALQNAPKNQRALLQLRDEYEKAFKEGWKPSDSEAAARTKLESQITTNADTILKKAKTDKEKADADAATAADKQKKINLEDLRRQLDDEQKRVGQLAQVWDRFGSQAEGSLGRIRQLEEQGGEAGEKTAKARVEAELLKRVYDGIPEPLRQSEIALTGIEEHMKRIVGMRDGFRQLFEGEFGKLSGPGRQQLAAFAADMEQRLGQGKAWRQLQAERTSTAIPLLGQVEGRIGNLRVQQERIQESLRSSADVYDEGKNLAGSVLDGIVSEAKSSKSKALCAEFATDVLHQFGVGLKGSKAAGVLVQQAKDARAKTIPVSQAGPGDLIYQYGPDKGVIKDANGNGYHVGVAVGDGKMVARNRNYYGPVWKNAVALDTSSLSNNGIASSTTSEKLPNNPPAVINYDPREVRMPADIGFDSRLLRMRDLPAAWGGMMRDKVAMPGEVTGMREGVESLLMQYYTQYAPARDRLAARRSAGKGGVPLSPEFMNRDFTADKNTVADLQGLFTQYALKQTRAGANNVDFASSVDAVTRSARNSVRQMGAEIRAAANDNNPYLALLDGFKYGENRFLSEDWKKRLEEMTLGKMVETTRAATRRMRDQMSGQINARTGLLGMLGVGYNAGEYERSAFISSKKAEIYDSEDIRHLRDAGKETEATRQAQIRLNMAIRDFDSSKLEAGLRSYWQGMVAQRQAVELGETEIRLLKEGAGARQQITDALEIEVQYREQLKALVGAGAPYAEGKARDYAYGLVNRRNQRMATERYDQNQSFLTDAAKQIISATGIPGTGFDGQLGLLGKFQINDPRYGIEKQIAQRRAELLVNNQQDPEHAVVIDDHLKVYRQVLEAGQKVTQAEEAANAILQSRNGILDQQSQRQSSLARTAKERLDIELTAEAERRKLAGRAETAEETRYRLMLEGERRLTAAQEDRYSKLQKRNDEARSAIRSLMDNDLKGLANNLVSRMKDQISERWAERLSGLGVFRREGQKAGSGKLTQAGEFVAATSDTFFRPEGPTSTVSAMSEQIRSALQSITISQATVQILTASQITVNSAGVVNTPGAGGGGFTNLPFIGGGNGAPGTMATMSQFAASVGDDWSFGGK